MKDYSSSRQDGEVEVELKNCQQGSSIDNINYSLKEAADTYTHTHTHESRIHGNKKRDFLMLLSKVQCES